MKWISRNLIILSILLSVCLLSACGKSTPNANGEGAPLRPFIPLTEIKEDQKNVYLIVKAFNNNYWAAVVDSIKNAAEYEGCNIYYSGSEKEAEWEKQVMLLDMAVEAGADAIIIAPDHSTELAEPISKVYQLGIPVVLVDTTITVDDYDVCYMTDNLLAGRKSAVEMLAQLKGMGYTEEDSLTIGVGVGSATSQTISERLAGFCQYWSENAPKNWKITDDVKINGGDIDKAEQLTGEMFANTPDMKGVFGCNNSSTVGLARWLIKQNRTDVAMVGFDYSEEMAGLIQNPDYHAATMVQREQEMGRLSVRTVMELCDGQSAEEKFVDTGVVVVNKDTLHSAEVEAIISSN